MNNDGFISKPNNWNKISFHYEEQFKNNINLTSLNKKYDVVFILAGGFNNNGEINEWVKRRLKLFYKNF